MQAAWPQGLGLLQVADVYGHVMSSPHSGCDMELPGGCTAERLCHLLVTVLSCVCERHSFLVGMMVLCSV